MTHHPPVNPIIDALLPSGVEAKAITETTRVELTLSPQQASALYNDIYSITNDAGIATAHDRGARFPALFAVYDALHAAGVDGTAAQS